MLRDKKTQNQVRKQKEKKVCDVNPAGYLNDLVKELS